MSTTVTKPDKTKPNKRGIQEWLESDVFKRQIAAVLPKHITEERMVRAAITATMRTPLLAQCDQASFFNQMLLLSQFGLEPDGRRAHLIPFWNAKRKVYECQLILDYKGVVELILRTGAVSTIHADKVCENDQFIYNCGQVEKHQVDFRQPRGPAYAYYCVITRKDGTRKCEVMSVEEVNQIRARSKSAESGPWMTDYDEMAKKTVFKRASKWVELSSEIRDILAADNDLVIDAAVITPGKIATAPRGTEGLRAKLLASPASPATCEATEPYREPELPPELPHQAETDGEDFARSARVRQQYLEQLRTTVKSGALRSLLSDAKSDELLSEVDRVVVITEIEDRIAVAESQL